RHVHHRLRREAPRDEAVRREAPGAVSAAATPAAAAGAAPAYIAIEGVSLVYGAGGEGAVAALDDVSLGIGAGDFVSIVGPSGCGKSTLLKCVGDLLAPTAGRIAIGGREASALRRDGRIGFVFPQASL